MLLLLLGAGWTGGVAAQGRERRSQARRGRVRRLAPVQHPLCALSRAGRARAIRSRRTCSSRLAAGGPVAEPTAFVAVVEEGRPKRGMPGFAKVIDDAQTAAIYAYVKGRADGKIPAGRPARRRLERRRCLAA